MLQKTIEVQQEVNLPIGEFSGHRHLSLKIINVDFFGVRFLTLVHIHQKPNVKNKNCESLSQREVRFSMYVYDVKSNIEYPMSNLTLCIFSDKCPRRNFIQMARIRFSHIFKIFCIQKTSPQSYKSQLLLVTKTVRNWPQWSQWEQSFIKLKLEETK